MKGLRDRAAFAAAFLAGTAGCGAILGIDPGVPEDAGAMHPDTGMATEKDVLADVALDVGHLPDGTAATTIYVSTAGLDSMSCGLTTVNPCQSVGQGVIQASAAGAKTILLAQGTYVGSLDLSSVGSGLTIEGGVGAQFESLSSTGPSPSAAVLKATGAYVVRAKALTGPVTLSELTLTNASTAAPGESEYGVEALGNSSTAGITLNDVVISVANGGDGAAGTMGMQGAAGAACASPGSGDPGPVGAVGLPGMFGSTGYVAGAPGGVGGNGIAGGPGAPGMSACLTCYAGCSSTITGCVSLNANGMTCGAGGAGGCGGGGGVGGTGGSGGGSSVGVFGWDSPVTITAGSVTSGNGGTGGPGGHGGQGGGGGEGLPGGFGTACLTSCTDNVFNCTENSTPGLGQRGMPGGTGGSGGNGGGGAGGSTYAVYVGGMYSAAVSPSVQLNTGTAGMGDIGPPAAQSGVAKTIGP